MRMARSVILACLSDFALINAERVESSEDTPLMQATHLSELKELNLESKPLNAIYAAEEGAKDEKFRAYGAYPTRYEYAQEGAKESFAHAPVVAAAAEEGAKDEKLLTGYLPSEIFAGKGVKVPRELPSEIWAGKRGYRAPVLTDEEGAKDQRYAQYAQEEVEGSFAHAPVVAAAAEEGVKDEKLLTGYLPSEIFAGKGVKVPRELPSEIWAGKRGYRAPVLTDEEGAKDERYARYAQEEATVGHKVTGHTIMAEEAGKVHGALARQGKVKGQTPKQRRKQKKGDRMRATKRIQYNRRAVNVEEALGKFGKKGPNSQAR